jgi:uncharacterized protein DUF6677
LADPGSTDSGPAPKLTPVGRPALAAVAAWLVPGLGHVYLRRWRRGVAFFLLVIVSLWVGWSLKGNLYRPLPNEPLSVLGTLGALGMGIPYFLFRTQGYSGDILAPGYEYGTAFLLTAGLMNWLLVLDAWDISRGKKE